MDDQHILLWRPSKGNLGADVTSLIGSLVVTKLSLAALSRQDTPEAQRKPHYLYVDEVQNFVYGMDQYPPGWPRYEVEAYRLDGAFILGATDDPAAAERLPAGEHFHVVECDVFGVPSENGI